MPTLNITDITPTGNITDITPIGTYVNAVMTAQDADRRSANRHFQSGVFSQLKTLRPADKALRAMATEEAARSRRRRSDHVPFPWRGGLACVGILATVVVALFS
jgi:hypothetical protein